MNFFKSAICVVTVTALLAVTVLNGTASKVQAKSNYDHKIVLDLNPVETNGFLKSDTFKKGNKKYLGEDLSDVDKKYASIELDFNLGEDGEKETSIHGEGKLKIKGIDNIKFTFDDNIRNTTIDGNKIYFGPVLATADGKKGNTQSVLGLYFDSQKDEAVISATVGEMGADGNAVIVFGDIVAGYKEAVDQVRSLLKTGEPANEANVAKTALSELVEPNVAKAETVPISTRFDYKTTVSTGGIAPTSDPNYPPAPSYQPYDVFGMNIYSREAYLSGNGTAMVYVRGWSNTAQVVNYMYGHPPASDPYGNTQWNASLWNLYMGAGNTNLLLNMDLNLTTPKDTDSIKAYKVPIKGTAGTIINVLFNAFAQYYNYTKPITTQNKKYSTANSSWLAYAEKRINELDVLADLPYRQDYASNEINSNGGQAVQFYFNEQVDGVQDMYVKGKAVYLGGSNYTSAIIWYVTPQIETSFRHSFS